VEYFPEPVAYNFSNALVKVPGLDGSGKMGKSEGEGNAIFLVDEPEVIKKKVMRAVTDSGPMALNQPKPEAIQNIFTLLNLVSKPDTVQHFEDAYNNMTIRYGDIKKQLTEDMNSFIAPIREKIKEISADEAYIKKTMKAGAEKARESGRKTVKEVREIIGIKSFV
jgi:tryptophanyl-tRNA synthetase